MDDLWLAIVIVGQLGFVGWMAHLWVQVRQRRREERLEAHNRLLDRFESNDELISFLGSNEGERLMNAFVPQNPRPHRRTLWSLQAGLILCLAGSALLVFRAETFEPDVSTFLGAIASATGLGLLLSAVIGHLLMRAWGVLDGDDEG